MTYLALDSSDLDEHPVDAERLQQTHESAVSAFQSIADAYRRQIFLPSELTNRYSDVTSQ